jgi:phage virion morphogenesis protein
MAGVSVNVAIDDSEVRELLSQVLARMDDVTPAMKEIGEIVIESVQRNFEEKRSPEGNRWQELANETIREKVLRGRGPTDILIDRGILMGSIHRQADAHGVTIGTNVVYAAVHQFGAAFTTLKGRRTVRIPARPYLGVRDTDWPEIGAALRRYILEGR